MPYVYESRKFQSVATRWFEYHCLESEKSSDAELWHRTHQQVAVLGLSGSEETPVLSIQFMDGFKGECWIDELVKSPEQFTRPDYK